jgi:hypothetical protein
MRQDADQTVQMECVLITVYDWSGWETLISPAVQ